MLTAIEIRNLSKIYRHAGNAQAAAVDNLDLIVEPGQVLGFLGPNGAGKTTTIKMICGLITPTTGSIRVNSHDVARERNIVMRQIGAVLEGTRNVYWRLSAWQNLMYFGRLKGCTGPALKTRGESLLRELELWERRHDPVRQFSRGMQQKVAIACALIADPPIVLLDEPTLGLDVQAARTVQNWVTKLAREHGKTIVLTSHQLDMVQTVCDRVAVMRKGRLLADKPMAELLALFRAEHYQIKVAGHLNGHSSAHLAGFTLAPVDGGTVLAGALDDQASLYRVLDHIRELGLPLISVNRIEPDLEDVFVQLIESQG
jgi:ABC-2 type transport system ATP-binding protein